MTPQEFQQQASELDHKINALNDQLTGLREELSQFSAGAAEQISNMAAQHAPVAVSGNFVIDALGVLILAAFVGYYVIWNVTPALHAPLMGITNAISSVIIVGALIAAGPAVFGLSKTLGFFAIILASVNIFGGFVVTNRMLEMFKKKK